MRIEEPKRTCIWFQPIEYPYGQWGGDYPSFMGARCNKYDKEFVRYSNNSSSCSRIEPSCETCKFFEKGRTELEEEEKVLKDFLEKNPAMKKKQQEINNILNLVKEKDRLHTIYLLMAYLAISEIKELTEEIKKLNIYLGG